MVNCLWCKGTSDISHREKGLFSRCCHLQQHKIPPFLILSCSFSNSAEFRLLLVFTMKIFMRWKTSELEWAEHNGHKVVAVTEHYNNFTRSGIMMKCGALWIGKTIVIMVVRHAKGEGSLFCAWYKDA